MWRRCVALIVSTIDRLASAISFKRSLGLQECDACGTRERLDGLSREASEPYDDRRNGQALRINKDFANFAEGCGQP